jgi:hypothetical protein
MTMRRLIQFVYLLLLAFCIFQVTPAQAQQKKNDCGKPPQFIPPPKLSKEEKKKQPKVNLQGNVAIEISEDGDVISAKAVDPKSGDQSDQLVALAKMMKFKPRPGCGSYKTVVNYVLGMS